MYLNLEERLEYLKHRYPPTATADDTLRTVSFTGYRTAKLPFGNDYESEPAKKLRSLLMDIFDQLFQNNYNCFLTGGATGSDLIAADAVGEVLKSYGKRAARSINFICLPCYDHIKSWSQKDKNYLEKLLNDDVCAFYVSDRPYYKGCMQVRNKYMVDNSSIVVAVYDGKPGGTKNTLEYAEKRRRKIITVDPNASLKTELFITKKDTAPHFTILKDAKTKYKINKH